MVRTYSVADQLRKLVNAVNRHGRADASYPGRMKIGGSLDRFEIMEVDPCETRGFMRDLKQLRLWLKNYKVTEIAMESLASIAR
jgi:hypothetical protein